MSAPKKREGGRFARLLGSFWRSPKVHALSPEARALYCAGLSYAADGATDGRIPKYMLPALHVGMPTALPIAMLCASHNGECPFWYDRGDHYEIHDFTDTNPTRAELEAMSERGRELAARRWDRARTESETDADRNATRSACGDAIPNPKSQIPNLSSQIPHPLNTRARATPVEVARAVESAAEALQGPPPWVEVLMRFDAAWERHHGCALGVEMAASQHRQKAEGVVKWARKQAGDDWPALVERAVEAAAPQIASAGSPFALFCASPGKWLTHAAAKPRGPAPVRQPHEFAGDDPDEFWDKVEAENAANR